MILQNICNLLEGQPAVPPQLRARFECAFRIHAGDRNAPAVSEPGKRPPTRRFIDEFEDSVRIAPLPTDNTSPAIPLIDHLEARALLAATVVHPTFVLEPYAGNGPGGGLSPSQLQTAYGFTNISFNGTPGTGKGETIAIVDAYNDPNIQSDLNTFDTEFGLPAITVNRVNETGGTSYPTSDPTGGWNSKSRSTSSGRTPWRPQANIMLVEASSTSDTDLWPP